MYHIYEENHPQVAAIPVDVRAMLEKHIAEKMWRFVSDGEHWMIVALPQGRFIFVRVPAEATDDECNTALVHALTEYHAAYAARNN